ncbi:hypothetical protein GWG54_04025 [Natronococcus sp. JC468]|nr:hypothetical protein [Natronococcus sp. JC468]
MCGTVSLEYRDATTDGLNGGRTAVADDAVGLVSKADSTSDPTRRSPNVTVLGRAVVVRRERQTRIADGNGDMDTEETDEERAGFTRRQLLAGLAGSTASVATVGTLGYARLDPVDRLEVRLWFSERAAAYGGVVERVREYLEALLAYDYWELELSVGGTVAVSREDGASVTSDGEWPATLASGAVGLGGVDPVADVNLLVTDGQMTTAPTGFALPHVASVGGARHLAALPPFDELEGVRDGGAVHRIVPDERPVRTIQVLLHEVGHALGLDHDHGVVFRDGERVVATPMLSSYAWDPDYEGDRSRCGREYPPADGRERALSLAFSTCARRGLESYDGTGL